MFLVPSILVAKFQQGVAVKSRKLTIKNIDVSTNLLVKSSNVS